MSIRDDEDLKEYFLMYEGTQEDYDNAPDDYLKAVKKSMGFVSYLFQEATHKLSKSLREGMRKDRDRLKKAALGIQNAIVKSQPKPNE